MSKRYSISDELLAIKIVEALIAVRALEPSPDGERRLQKIRASVAKRKRVRA